MVDVPNPEQPLTQAPTSRVTGGEIEGQFGRMAANIRQSDNSEGLAHLAAGLDALAIPFAEKAGADAGAAATITRNADGTPTVTVGPLFPTVGRAGLAQQRAAEAGALARGQNQVQVDITDLRNRANGDPQAFLKHVQEYSDGIRAAMPGKLGAAMAADAGRLGAQHYGSLVHQEYQVRTQNDQAAINAQLESAKNEALTLARQEGGVDRADYRTALTRVEGYYKQLAGNPVFGMPAEKAAIEIKHFQDFAKADAITSTVDRTYARNGKAAAQKALEDGVLSNTSINLSETERSHLYQTGMARLSYLTDANRAEIAANRKAVDGIEGTLTSGSMKPDDPAVDMAISQSRKIGDSEAVARIEAARAVTMKTWVGAGLNNADRVSAAMTGGAGGDYFTLTKQRESGGDPSAKAPTSSATGIYQFTSGTWDNVRAAHPELGLTPDGRTDPAQQERAMRAFTVDNGTALKKAGIDPTDKNLYLAHFLGAGGATTLIRAGQQNPAQPAAQVLPAAAAANPTVFYRKGEDGKPDLSQPRTVAEVYTNQTAGFGGGHSVMPASSNGIPFTREQVAANPFLISAYTRQLASDTGERNRIVSGVADAVLQGVKNGQAPPAEKAALLIQEAQRSPEVATKVEKINQELEAQTGAKQMLQMPAADARSGADALVAATSGASIYDQIVARSLRDHVHQGIKNLADNPFNEAVKRAWIPREPQPLNFDDPDKLMAGMAERGAAAERIGSHERDMSQSAIPTAEMPQVTSVITNGSLAQKSALIGAMSTLPQPILKATLAKLGSDKATAPFAMAAMLSRDNPEATKGILAGMEAMKAEPKLAPKDETRNMAFAKALPIPALPTAVRESVDTATTAYYAYLSAQQNDVSGVFKPQRMDDALRAVTGGVLDHRGTKVIAPWYGASQDQLDAALRSVTDDDLKGARTTGGDPFPARMLKPSVSNLFTSNGYRLMTAGSGRYAIVSGPAEKPVPVVGADGSPFVLDLGKKKSNPDVFNPAPQRWDASLAAGTNQFAAERAAQQ